MNEPTGTSGFERFCATNALIWGGAQPGASTDPARVILIDLWHNNIQYVMRSLLVAKYVQRARPATLVGLLGQPGVVVRSCGELDVALLERLARSYGVTEFRRAPLPSLTDFEKAGALLDRLDPGGDLDALAPAELRSRLTGLTLQDGFPIGRFAYDTALRSELRPTINRVDARLRRWTADCVSLHRWISELCRGLDGREPAAFVTGHLDYNPWGLVGEVVRRSGGEVFWFRLDYAVPVYRIGPAGAGTLGAGYHRIEADWFNAAIWPHHRDLAAGADAFAAADASGALHQRWTSARTAALPADTAGAAAAAWRRACGWDEGDVVVGVFAHALSDQPLADEQAYADRYQWLSGTLAFAARHPERRWLVKLHPRDAAYDATGASAELMQRFARFGHIRFVGAQAASGVPSGVPSGVLAALCDVAVTIFGAPGLEMAAAGRPVITAGNGPYAGCGFVHRATSRAHYEALLLADPAALRPTAEQTDRARLYAYAARVIGAPVSPLLDPPTTAPDDAYWRLAEARLRHHTMAGDDLHEAVRRMIDGGQARVTNPKLDRYRAERGTRAPAPALLPLLGAEPISFQAGCGGATGLIKGFTAPEDWGAWMTEDVAVLGLRVPVLVAEGCVRLTLAYRYWLATLPGWPTQCVSVFSRSSCLLARAPLQPVGELMISVPSGDVGGEGDVLLSLQIDRLLSPADVGLSTDPRRLAIGVTSVALTPEDRAATAS